MLLKEGSLTGAVVKVEGNGAEDEDEEDVVDEPAGDEDLQPVRMRANRSAAPSEARIMGNLLYGIVTILCSNSAHGARFDG
jgi:hypothetical protein